jgi:glycosyl transferase family 21
MRRPGVSYVPLCTYLLPIRRLHFRQAEASNLAEYLELLAAAGCEVLVVDGSAPEVFNQHDAAWSGLCRHLTVDRRFGYLNDKVNGVHTGIEKASSDKIILGDDDIRYDRAAIGAMVDSLEHFEVVRPQNFLSPLPWWARMESARMLINRATLRLADYPGTCGFRRGTMLRVGHYDGDVLFDNEEIIRHFAQSGARIDYANNFFVLKRPPTFRKWLEQRPRQAYEDFGLRLKTGLFLSLLPLGALLLAVKGWLGGTIFCIALAIGSVILAFMGRRKGQAAQYFPVSVCFFAPLWVFERALSSYWAVYYYITCGGYRFGEEILSKGIGRDWFRGGRVATQQLRESS